jgi:hypothetical protein
MGQARYSYKIVVRKLEVKKIFVRPRHTWEDNINMNLGDST